MSDFRADAENGDAEAQFALGVLLGNCLPDDGPRNADSHAQAIYWLRRASHQGLPRAQAKLAEIYSGQPRTPFDLVRAVGWYMRAMVSSSVAGLRKPERDN